MLWIFMSAYIVGTISLPYTASQSTESSVPSECSLQMLLRGKYSTVKNRGYCSR